MSTFCDHFLLLALICLVSGCGGEETLPEPASDSAVNAVNPPEPPAVAEPLTETPNALEAPTKNYTLADRPAGDWAGLWEGKPDKDRYVWIDNDSTGFLGLGPDVDLYDLTFQKEGELLRVKQMGKLLPYEITRGESRIKLTFKNTETGEEFECLKESDPITGIVLENVDRQRALERASTLSQLLMKDEKEISHFDLRREEFRKIVEIYFDSFQTVEAKKYLTLAMNPAQTGFDAIRFRTPAADHSWDLFWEFFADTSTKMHGWYILPREGELEGFSGYEHEYNVSIEGVELPEKNIHIKQSLTGGRLKPDSEYLIWFGNAASSQEPYELVVRLGFLPAQ